MWLQRFTDRAAPGLILLVLALAVSGCASSGPQTNSAESGRTEQSAPGDLGAAEVPPEALISSMKEHQKYFHVVGADGLSLEEAWTQGPRTYKSITLPGFPNYFMIVGPNSPIGNISIIDVSECQTAYIMDCIHELERDRSKALVPKREAAEAFQAELRDAMNATVDQDELIPMIAEAESIIADNVVIIPLYARLVTAAVWADEVAGFKHNPSQSQITWNMATWHRVDL